MQTYTWQDLQPAPFILVPPSYILYWPVISSLFWTTGLIIAIVFAYHPPTHEPGDLFNGYLELTGADLFIVGLQKGVRLHPQVHFEELLYQMVVYVPFFYTEIRFGLHRVVFLFLCCMVIGTVYIQCIYDRLFAVSGPSFCCGSFLLTSGIGLALVASYPESVIKQRPRRNQFLYWLFVAFIYFLIVCIDYASDNNKNPFVEAFFWNAHAYALGVFFAAGLLFKAV